MESDADRLFFVGAMPPPVHGMSNVNARMLAALGRVGMNIYLFDIARGRKKPTAETIPLPRNEGAVAQLIRFIRSMASVRGTRKTYLSLSGGLGQFRDLVYIMISRSFRAKIYVHHHSFAYLNRRSVITRLCCWTAGPRSDHIVLCERMAMLLTQQYGTRPERVSCLSNSAFLSPIERRVVRPNLKTVSFFSNITFEKGIDTFFQLANELHARKLPVRCLIAGPVAPEVRAWLEAALKCAPGVQYLGPQYGQDKVLFLEQTDLLVFPSTYANEAEPVTLLEAFSFGVPVIATALGCIPGLVGDERGFVLNAQPGLSLTMADLVQHLTQDAVAYQRLSENCNAYVENANSSQSSALNAIVEAIQCGRDFGADSRAGS
jgi:glycosyltransferase involved in cell wall biosynthesis